MRKRTKNNCEFLTHLACDMKTELKKLILHKSKSMLKKLSGFSEYLKKNPSVINNDKLGKVIQDFSFILISKKDELPNYFEKNQMINQNIKNTEIIMINKCDLHNENIKDEFLFLCFEKTLIILKQTMISSVYTLLSNNSNLSVCFIQNTKDIFTEKIINPIIEYDTIFKEEIENIGNNLYLREKSEISPFWPFILPCISGYLIKKSYFKKKHDTTRRFNDFKRDHFSLGKVDEKDYITLRNLGFGSLFVVQLIYHIERGELFALKKPNSIDKDIHKLIEREKENYEKIHHPFVPKFYGTVKDRGFLIIEFINGQTLDQCQFDEYNEDDIILIIYKLLSIVKYFHDNNFLIRDLKPNNVMIAETKDIFMIDFDRIISNSIQTNTVSLCNEYSAPEVNTDKIYSYKSDMYSLGKVIEFVLKKVNSKMKISSINDIMKQCLQENADQRPSIIKMICIFLIKIQNISSALSILKFPQVQFILGVIYENGDYAKRDINKAIYYYLLAANQNDQQAQFNLGSIYYTSEYVERDIKKAIYYYSLASKQNIPQAQNNLGAIYFTGEYIKRDINKAIYYFSLAANQNYPQAQFNLGSIYSTGEYVKRDINKAIYYFSLAANQNYPQVPFSLGLIYEKGEYAKRDINKAIYYYSLASNQNNPQAQNKLGSIYYTGEHVRII